MIGGGGSDVMVGGDPCDGDLYDGGTGEDNANFFRFTPGVTAKIGGAARRAGGEGCAPGRVRRSVEAMEGTPGPDRLTGDKRRNTLSGGAGNDVLRGRGDGDRLVGGNGGDRLIGGRGRDAAYQ
jgi:serralysin